jgi:hypothetical protein
MVYLSGMRGANVVDEGDEYYERAFDELARDMLHAKDNDEREFCLHLFKKKHQHDLHKLTNERLRDLRKLLIRELGPPVIDMFDVTFPTLTDEINHFLTSIFTNPYYKLVKRMKKFKREHISTLSEAKQMQGILQRRYPPHEDLHAELTYAFQEVFPEVPGGIRLNPDDLYPLMVNQFRTYNKRTARKYFEGLKKYCEFGTDRIIKLKEALDKRYGKDKDFLTVFQKVFPEVRHGHVWGYEEDVETLALSLQYCDFPHMVDRIKRFVEEVRRNNGGTMPEPMIVHLKRDLDRMYPVECNEHVDVMQAFQEEFPDVRFGLRVQTMTMHEYMAVLLKYCKGRPRVSQLLLSFSEYLDANPDLFRPFEVEELRKAVENVMRSDERKRNEVLSEMVNRFGEIAGGRGEGGMGGGGTGGGEGSARRSGGRQRDEDGDGGLGACLSTLEASLRRLEVSR